MSEVLAEAVDDLHYLEYCVQELENYLLAKELFWPVLVHPLNKDSGYPKLTLGNILLALRRLEALSLGHLLRGEEESEYQRLKTIVDSIHKKWEVAWERKAAHEYRSRFRQWSELLKEIFQNLEKQAPFYSADVRLRTLLALLEEDAPADKRPDVQPLDTNLRAIFRHGGFIWEKEYRPGFPEDTFWFLYGEIFTD
jgi:hypothetical protein